MFYAKAGFLAFIIEKALRIGISHARAQAALRKLIK